MIASGVSALPYDDSAGFTAPPAFGTFRVLHQIGSGALGPVFRAYEPQHERLIAVKAFRLDIVPERAARLADELRRLAATPVDSPRVVPPVGAGLEGMTPYLAYEYVAAETFDVALRRLAPAPLDRARPVLRQVAEAIEAAWAAGIGHGALHPRDVFVTQESPEAVEVRVAGFGVAAALDHLDIRMPARRPYAAPERAAGRPWDVRADVYALGVLAHELLTGRRPSGVGEQDGALPTGTTPEQRVAIRRALAGVLQEDPARRYATPSAFLAALETGDAPAVSAGEASHDDGEVAPPAPPPPPAIQPPPAAPAIQPPAALAAIQPPPAIPPPLAIPAILPPPATPAAGPSWALLIVGLVIGAGVGYWWRGPAGPPAEPVMATIAVGEEAPVGTEVPVTDPAASPVPQANATRPTTGAAEPAATRGRLLVRSVPAGARVMISGRSRGVTPATVRDLPFGTYNVTVSRDGYQSRVQRVTLTRAVPARDITVELRPAPPAATAAATGAVYIDTRPSGARVTIDGRTAGTTPLRVPELAPGSHTIRLELAGHKSVTTTVVVRAGQQVPVRVSLEVM